MSLWEKWEREKLEKMGAKVERKSDVEIYDTRPKANVRRQFWIVGGALLACLLAVYLALAMASIYNGRWSELFIVRLFVERAELRTAQSAGNQ